MTRSVTRTLVTSIATLGVLCLLSSFTDSAQAQNVATPTTRPGGQFVGGIFTGNGQLRGGGFAPRPRAPGALRPTLDQ